MLEVGQSKMTFNGYTFTVLEKKFDEIRNEWLYLINIEPRAINPSWMSESEYEEEYKKHYLCNRVDYEDYWDENGNVKWPPIDLLEKQLKRDGL